MGFNVVYHYLDEDKIQKEFLIVLDLWIRKEETKKVLCDDKGNPLYHDNGEVKEAVFNSYVFKWPTTSGPWSNTKLRELYRKKEIPDSTWEEYNCCFVKRKETYATAEKILRACQEAERKGESIAEAAKSADDEPPPKETRKFRALRAEEASRKVAWPPRRKRRSGPSLCRVEDLHSPTISDSEDGSPPHHKGTDLESDDDLDDSVLQSNQNALTSLQQSLNNTNSTPSASPLLPPPSTPLASTPKRRKMKDEDEILRKLYPGVDLDKPITGRDFLKCHRILMKAVLQLKGTYSSQPLCENEVSGGTSEEADDILRQWPVMDKDAFTTLEAALFSRREEEVQLEGSGSSKKGKYKSMLKAIIAEEKFIHKNVEGMIPKLLKAMFSVQVQPHFVFSSKSTTKNPDTIRFEVTESYMVVKDVVLLKHPSADILTIREKIKTWWDHKSDRTKGIAKND
ncbi:hypothetical protein Fcan01_24607 [Folsomia candida]|uniref:Uncharacterized protein n=1 Tax=Folsomia candida TaxID=158441 RepID=A0A226D7P7_FOLCA|nr:hypothetical protein Fcan01_24607 [Folsomia candida]